MALLPLQGMVRGDFVVHLIPVDDQDSMNAVADKIARHTLGRRLPLTTEQLRVFTADGRELTPDSTVVEAGLQPLDVLEVRVG